MIPRSLPPGLVVVVTLTAFLPTLGNGFASWDDALNFLDNPHYRGLGPAQLRWMFTTFHAGHYIPLTWLSLGLDYLLWGLYPAGYHLTSLLLHAATALALAVLTWQQTSVWRNAVTLWSHAASLGSGGRAAHANLADALDAAGRPGEAIPHYLEALRRSAKKAPWHVRLGQLYARAGDDSAAVRHFSGALAEEPGLPDACDAVRDLATRSTAAARLLTTCAGPR